MTFDRRSFLIGAGTGLSLLVLSACTTPTPEPLPSFTPTPTPGVPQPAGLLRSSWSKDPFSRGSHSFSTVGSTPEHRESLATPLGDRVFFAGEATSSDNPGTVLGARVTGARAATDLARAGDSSEKIAIIGAGAAGAEAARMLTVFGYDVTVIEARDRVGGRIDTVTKSDWPVPAELGAWLLRRETDASVVSQVRASTIAPALYRDGDTDAIEDPVGPAAVTAAVEWAASQSADLPLDTALVDSGADAGLADVNGIPGADLLEAYVASLATIYGADPSELSSWYGIDQVDETRVAVRDGFSTVISDALDGIDTFLATTVTDITYTDSKVSLRLGTGESLSVDRVIVTVPLGVLKSGAITFNPLLPFEHRTAIAALGMGTVDTVWLRFDEPFWSTDAVAWTIVGDADDASTPTPAPSDDSSDSDSSDAEATASDTRITTWFNLLPLTGEPILVGLVGGADALALAELNDSELAGVALESLKPFAA